MKSLLYNQKLYVGLISLLIITVAVISFTDNQVKHLFKNYLANNEITGSIIYSAIIVLGVNLLIFGIGIISRKSSKKNSIMHKAYKKSRYNRRRRIETRQFDVLSQYR